MITKLIELRDRATFIPCIAIKLTPHGGASPFAPDDKRAAIAEANRFLLSRAGFGTTPSEQSEYVLLGKITGGDKLRFECDPFEWSDRTFMMAHDHIIKRFDDIESGDVVDVEFIMGETTQPKVSERFDD